MNSYNTGLLALTDDLTPNQFQDLLCWLRQGGYMVNIRTIEKWRQLQGLNTDRNISNFHMDC